MGQFVTPKVFLIGYTDVDERGLIEYLKYTGQEDFLETWKQARAEGISAGEALCSFYSKICYKSLTLGKNSNLSRIRDIEANIRSIFDTAHGSVVEHCNLNFIITDCSRVLTHEACRHRAGVALSQTSGRYCRLDSIDFVFDPILEPVRELVDGHLRKTEELVYLLECRLGLRKPPAAYPKAPADVIYSSPHYMYTVIRAQDGDYDQFEPLNLTKDRLRWVPDGTFDFEKRKKLTSAIRRIAPNGQANELGISINVRALRHIVQLRTARHAEWEIRAVFAQVYDLVRAKFPLIFHGARVREYDGLPEVYNMKTQPYELLPGDPRALEFFTAEQLSQEALRRLQAAVDKDAGPTEETAMK